MSDLLFGLAALGLGHLQDADIFEELTKKEQALKEGPVIPEEKDMIFDKKMVCPVCDKEFMTKCLKAGKTRFLGNDLDLRPLYEGIDAQKYDIILCPNCGYAALNKFFAHVTPKQIKAINSELTVENAIMAPKADYFDQMVDRNLLTNFRETAKELHIKQKAFVGFLLDHKYIYRDKRGKLMPYEDKNDGLFEVKECYNEKTQWSGTQTLLTPKGRETFRLLCQGL